MVQETHLERKLRQLVCYLHGLPLLPLALEAAEHLEPASSPAGSQGCHFVAGSQCRCCGSREKTQL